MTRDGETEILLLETSSYIVKSKRKIGVLISSFNFLSNLLYPLNDFLGKQCHTECSLRKSLATCA